MEPKTELEMYRMLLIMHLKGFIYELRQMPMDKWDWTSVTSPQRENSLRVSCRMETEDIAAKQTSTQPPCTTSSRFRITSLLLRGELRLQYSGVIGLLPMTCYPRVFQQRQPSWIS